MIEPGERMHVTAGAVLLHLPQEFTPVEETSMVTNPPRDLLRTDA